MLKPEMLQQSECKEPQVIHLIERPETRDV